MEVPGLDLDAFRRWYDGERPGEIDGDLSASLIAGGKSNLTYEVTDGTSWWIVRRPPLGHVQATAHDMGREYTAMSALADTGVPVPRTYAHCADDSVLGAPFYVMERVDGRRLPQGGRARRAAAPSAPPRSPAGWSRCSPRCTPSTRRPSGWESSAGRRASSSGRYAAGASSSRAPRPATTPTPTSCTGC